MQSLSKTKALFRSKNQSLTEIFICPLTRKIMKNPVIISDSFSYECEAIKEWITNSLAKNGHVTSPVTKEPLTSLELIPNTALRETILLYQMMLAEQFEHELNESKISLTIKLQEKVQTKEHKTEDEKLLSRSSQDISVENFETHSETEEEKLYEEMARRNYEVIAELEATRKTSLNTYFAVNRHLSEIYFLSQQLAELENKHAVNVIKRFLVRIITRKKLKANKFHKQENNNALVPLSSPPQPSAVLDATAFSKEKRNELKRWCNLNKKYTKKIEKQRRYMAIFSENCLVEARYLKKHVGIIDTKIMRFFPTYESKLKIDNPRQKIFCQRVDAKNQGQSRNTSPSSISDLLTYTIRGELNKVSECLAQNKDLVYAQGDITDLSGREFKNITAFQYAIWALDKEMWELILNYLPEEDARDQLIALREERKDILLIYNRSFSLTSLQKAQQSYTENYHKRSSKEQEDCWCHEIGNAQREFPAWLIYVFCEKGEDKAWPTENPNKPFTRNPQLLEWWFNHEYKKGKLGETWAVLRGIGWPEVGPEGARAIVSYEKKRVPLDPVTSKFITNRQQALSTLIEKLSQIIFYPPTPKRF